jgi:methylmalonyl-CoA mutase C-terminal domain/subunit
VDVIGLSCALGHHTAHSAEILMGLKEIGKKDTPVIVGGNFPSDDIPEMLQVGVSAVFEPGTLTTDIIEWVKGVLKT